MRSSLRFLSGALFLLAPITTPTLAQEAAETSTGQIERAIAVANDLSMAFEHAAEIVAPSVVNVRSVTRVSSGLQRITPFEGSPFRDFFGDEFFQRFLTPGPSGGLVRRGQGSGFIVSDDGYILTNNHVVDNATEITVQLRDEREFRAKVVGADPSTDLALIKIDAQNLTPARFGDSDQVREGSWVVAVGNPFGLQSTITAGIVSATGRTRVGIADYEDFIQTDAAINPGNSGGPLVNLNGEVVGVNTAIATRSGGNMGIGFAIPSNFAQSIMDELRVHGAVTRGWLGVIIQDLEEGLARSFGFEGTNGVLISEVRAGGPAAAAGRLEGDIVTSFDGHEVSDVSELRMRVADTEPGREVEMEVFRDGRTRSIEVKIGRLEPEYSVASNSLGSNALGLQLRDLNEGGPTSLGAGVEHGALVTAVEPLTPAARAGIRAGDVITHVQGERVDSVRDFHRRLREHDLSEGVRLTVHSASAKRFVFLRDNEPRG
jgi:serine protease Do